MKIQKKLTGTFLPITQIAVLTMTLAAVGCSTMSGKGKSEADLATTGPTVVNARANPDTIELNRNLQPLQQPEILADVKDFTGKVDEVRLQFVRVPMEIPMQHIGGTTWRAQLTGEQLRTLAVGGQTMTYEANVIATNDKGMTAVSRDPVEINVAAPDLARKQG